MLSTFRVCNDATVQEKRKIRPLWQTLISNQGRNMLNQDKIKQHFKTITILGYDLERESLYNYWIKWIAQNVFMWKKRESCFDLDIPAFISYTNIKSINLKRILLMKNAYISNLNLIPLISHKICSPDGHRALLLLWGGGSVSTTCTWGRLRKRGLTLWTLPVNKEDVCRTLHDNHVQEGHKF